MRIIRFISLSAPSRFLNSLRFYFLGARVSPATWVKGKVRIGRGTSLGRRCAIEAGPDGSVEFAPNIWIASDVEVQASNLVSIGPGTTVQRRCTINGNVRLGTQCILAPNVFISSGSHPFRAIPHLPIRSQEQSLIARGKSLPNQIVVIDDDCWIGTNVVICPGVRIGKGSVIGANSVVTHNVDPYTVVAGVPAKLISRRINWVPPKSIDLSVPEELPYLTSPIPWNQAGSLMVGSVSKDSPLEMHLAANTSSSVFRIEGNSIGDTQLHIGNEVRNVSIGDFMLEIHSHSLLATNTGVILSIQTDSAVIRVKRVVVVSKNQ